MWSPSAASVAAFVAGWLCGWFLLWRPRRLAPTGPPPRPPVAVVIPARDEEASLPTLLAGLLPQLREGDECVVVDDGSRDRTASLAAAGGATVVPPGPPPAGWTGKAWACRAGVDATSADLLVLLDADVRLDSEDALDRVAAAAAGPHGALVSVQPWHRTGRPVEQLSALFNVVALMGSGAFTALGGRVRPAVAFGPVLACHRATYEASGGHGHSAVRSAVAEDIALARRFRAVGLPVVLHTGRPDVSFRMYPDGAGALMEGWTRSFASGVVSTPWWAGLLVAGWICSLAGGWFVSPWCYVATAVQIGVLGRRAGRFGLLSTLGYPVLVAVFLVVLVRSVVLRSLRRPVRWKGRRVAPRPSR